MEEILETTRVSAWSLVEKNRWVLSGWLVCLSLCVSFQNEIFEGEHRRRPSVNRNSFSKEKNFLRSLGLLGNASQFLKWRLLLCRSSENILYHLKGEHVPKSTEQYLCASSVFFFFFFFFISAKQTANVSAWSLVEKNQYRIRPWVNRNSFSHEKNFVFSLGLLL